MGASISRRVPGTATQQPEAERALDLSRLPPELLLLVLSHVPPRVLLGRCRRVCRGWRALVDGQALWLLILARDHPALLPVARGCLPPGVVGPKYLARFCVLRPMARNLIRNPCGQDGLQKWMVRHGGDGWLVEPNLTPVPGAPSQTCFASSFRWGARHDCGCRYRLLVQLLDASHMTLDEFSAEPEPIEQWNNCASHHVTHVFSNIQKGLRFVSFQHWGQDTKFWAGHYGARVTNSSVIVRVCSSTPTDDC
ncbi:F-box only protein 27 isoform X2 [Erinaceus europaeus]|uniref:F-box only protein 27 isoform X2 n=1 Tax=Erinaceus europaeus TaxID=9365 RepID=A0ABM3WZ83_ERIEU|nr:F-box only protein 27 isoform X2 [Erinaceus europaeus]